MHLCSLEGRDSISSRELQKTPLQARAWILPAWRYLPFHPLRGIRSISRVQPPGKAALSRSCAPFSVRKSRIEEARIGRRGKFGWQVPRCVADVVHRASSSLGVREDAIAPRIAVIISRSFFVFVSFDLGREVNTRIRTFWLHKFSTDGPRKCISYIELVIDERLILFGHPCRARSIFIFFRTVPIISGNVLHVRYFCIDGPTKWNV